MFLLHTHASEGDALIRFLNNVILEGLLDTLKLLPFLFFTYLFMEFIEHKAGGRFRDFMKKSGRFGPFVGGALGILPQCGFSVVASNLFTTKVITVGTLVAVFLSTSDEMLPILISGGVGIDKLTIIIIYKLIVAVLVGFFVDFLFKLLGKSRQEINIDELCENDNCNCEKGICSSALHHTLTVGSFILIATLILNLLIFFLGEENISAFIGNMPMLSHLVCTLLGIIPNCAASVVLSELYCGGIITAGAMLSGLFTGSGVGLLVLLRINKHPKENAIILAILILSGIFAGALFDVLPFTFI